MANAVSKESVKWFVTAVVAELDKRNNAKFASNTALNAVKSDLTDLEDKVADIDADKFVAKGFLPTTSPTKKRHFWLNSLTQPTLPSTKKTLLTFSVNH